MTSLLAKTRTLNKMLQKAAGHAVNFMDMAEVLRDTIQSDVFVVSRKGKILGYALASPPETPEMHMWVVEDRRFPEDYNQLLMQVMETASHLDPESAYIHITNRLHEMMHRNQITVVPIIGGGDRIGTLVLSRAAEAFHDEDLILGEYGATIVGMEILRERSEEAELEARSKAIVQVAVGSLSFSELEAVEHIFEQLDGKEGLLVASKIADRAGITRSVIVNALRKLESAGVIETRSLGMKGTYIKILNPNLLDELAKVKL